MHPLFINLLLLSIFLAGVGIWGFIKLSQPYRWLSFFVGLIAALVSLPLGLITAFGLMMCATEITAQGELPEQRLSWAIERSDCGATTADNYRVLLGRFGWWRHEIYTAYAWPAPISVVSAGPDAVRVILHPDDTPREGFVIPISWLGRVEKPLSFYRGEPKE